MKDTCKQAIFRKDTRRAKRVEDLCTAGDQGKSELEFFNNVCQPINEIISQMPRYMDQYKYKTKAEVTSQVEDTKQYAIMMQ